MPFRESYFRIGSPRGGGSRARTRRAGNRRHGAPLPGDPDKPSVEPAGPTPESAGPSSSTLRTVHASLLRGELALLETMIRGLVRSGQVQEALAPLSDLLEAVRRAVALYGIPEPPASRAMRREGP